MSPFFSFWKANFFDSKSFFSISIFLFSAGTVTVTFFLLAAVSFLMSLIYFALSSRSFLISASNSFFFLSISLWGFFRLLISSNSFS